MIKAIIIDDEKNAREAISEIIKIYSSNVSIVAEAENVKYGIEAIHAHRPQLVFLDIDMPDGTGFDLLKKIGDISFKIIFVTAYEEYAVKAFRYSALDYLLKPVDPDELIKSIASAEESINKENIGKQLETYFSAASNANRKPQKIVLKTTDDIFVIDISDIIRCESDGNYTTVHLNDTKKIMVARTLKEYEDLLSIHGFIRPHQSHLININYFDRFHKSDGGYVILKDKSEIPVSSRKKEQLLKMLEQL